MIRSRRGLITVAILSALFTLVLTFPARIAYSWASIPGVLVSGIEGSVWNGQAREASVNGIYVRDLKWRLLAMRLFSAELAYGFDAEPASGFANGEIGISGGSDVAIRDLKASLPAALLNAPLDMQGLQGTVNFEFSRIDLRDGVPIAANGTLRVASLVVPVVGRDSLGAYRAEFTTQNNGINAAVEDIDRVIDLAASLQLRADRSWEFSGLVVAQPNTPASIRAQMRFLGPANARGQQEIRLEGRF